MRNKLILIVLVIVVFGPPVAAIVTINFFPPKITNNHGELLDPWLLPERIMPANAGAGNDKWHLLAIGPADCDGACAARLCVLRQVRVAHIGDLDRVERIWVYTGDGQPATSLLSEPACGRPLPAEQAKNLQPVEVIAGVTTHPADKFLLAELPPPSKGHSRSDFIYLVDPSGLIMMRYPQDVDAKDIVKDLGRLLRLSRRVQVDSDKNT